MSLPALAETEVDLGVVALFPPTQQAELLRVVDVIAQRFSLASRVDATTRPPHLTLFQGRFPQRAIPDIAREIPQVAISFRVSSWFTFSRQNGNVFSVVVRNPELLTLHETLCRTLHPLTKGRLMAQFQRMLNDPDTLPKTCMRIRQYGAVLAGPEGFFPHVTLGRLKDGWGEVHLQGIEHKELHVPVRSLALAELRGDGSIAQVLETISFAA